MSDLKRIPLFPLTSHVLPGGQLKLRIFEPRYLRMVKEAVAQNQGIGMCMLDPLGSKDDNTHILGVGTLATIIDFERLPDGLLGITVEGQQRFRIQHIETEKDELRFGSVELLNNWPMEQLADEDCTLKNRIEEIYKEYPELVQLCPQQHVERADWLCLRWLEILPLDPSTKQKLLDSDDCAKARDYIRQLIQ